MNWEKGKIRTDSPKTGERFVPIFAELRPSLEDAYYLAGGAKADKAATVVDHPADKSWNYATHLARIIKDKAKLTPWPKLFQNLRLTRQTELAANWPIHVVCEWIGNSQAVAMEHYLRATDDDFNAAGKPAHFPAQNAPERRGHADAGVRKWPGFSISRPFEKRVSTPHRSTTTSINAGENQLRLMVVRKVVRFTMKHLESSLPFGRHSRNL